MELEEDDEKKPLEARGRTSVGEMFKVVLWNKPLEARGSLPLFAELVPAEALGLEIDN